jgi:hypothetical protein
MGEKKNNRKKEKQPFFSKDNIWYVIPNSKTKREILMAKVGTLALVAAFVFGVLSLYQFSGFKQINEGNGNINVQINEGTIIATPLDSTFTATIHITDWKGRPDEKINDNIEIRILNDKQKPNSEGIVSFSGMLAEYKNKPVRVEFFPCKDCRGWELVCDTICLQEKPKWSELRIKIKGLEQIYGTVTDDKGNLVDSAKVEIIDSQPLIYTYTDNGKYKIDICIKQQEYRQRIRVSKIKFKDGELYTYLENNINPINFKLSHE